MFKFGEILIKLSKKSGKVSRVVTYAAEGSYSDHTLTNSSM